MHASSTRISNWLVEMELVDSDVTGILGLVVFNDNGAMAATLGVGTDPRVKAVVSDRSWLAEATQKRTMPLRLNDKELIALVKQVSGGTLVILSDVPSDTVLNFILSVDFAYNIIEHILTDPYDAMAIVDAKARLAFISPVHEKFFGLRQSEGIGRKVKDVIENSRLPHVVRTGVAEVGQIQRMRGQDRVVSRHPILRDGKVVGAIGRIMFKGPQQLDAFARRINELEQKVAVYQNESRERAKAEKFLEAIVGQSLGVQSLRQQILKVAPLDIPVLIQGESGTGKELVAKALHMLSARQDARLVTVNAAALPESLVESELFGYEAGSFTGADKRGRPGKFELADKGTIFLDEIGDMPLEVQTKLLRVLQDRMVERIGGERPKQVDFRLCSATNRDLEQFVDEGRFRLDLYYRISPVQIILPPLRDRVEDIPLLVGHFVRELAKQYNRTEPEIDINVYDYLSEQPWPGNVRQLRHAIERALVFAEHGRLTLDDFRQDGASPRGASVRPAPKLADQAHSGGSLKEATERLESQLIADALVRFKGNKKRAAEHLGVSRSFLYKRLEELQLG